MKKEIKNILVTGAVGQIGSELTVALREKFGANNVIATGRKTQPSVAFRNAGPFHFIDVTNTDSVVNCRGLNDPEAPLEDQARAAATWIPAMVFAQPAWFVALRELSLTVFAPSNWSAALGMERLSLTVAGRNLVKWHDYGGLDPEVNQSGISQFTTYDLGAQPQVRYWTIRMNVGF